MYLWSAYQRYSFYTRLSFYVSWTDQLGKLKATVGTIMCALSFGWNWGDISWGETHILAYMVHLKYMKAINIIFMNEIRHLSPSKQIRNGNFSIACLTFISSAVT